MWENLHISAEKAGNREGTECDDTGEEAEDSIGYEDGRVGDSRNRPVRMPVLHRDLPSASSNRTVSIAHRGSGDYRRRPHPVRNYQGEARRLIFAGYRHGRWIPV